MPSRTFGVISTPRILFALCGTAAIAACSGAGTTLAPSHPAPVASIAGSPSPSPSPVAPAAVATTEPVTVTNNAISAPLPAPSGYTSNISIPIANAAAGTTVAITSSTTLPPSLPVLQSKSRSASTVRVPQAASNLTPIFFDSIVPSAAITVAGSISASQGFPAGVLSTSGQYYLAFFDSTQPSPAWQTISGPVTTTDGRTLTFGGMTNSFTLQTNDLYGFAIFSLANATATPPPAGQTLAYIGGGTSGIQEITATAVATTLPIDSDSLGLDDSGNMYVTVEPSPAPSGSAQGAPVTSMYPAGSTTPKYTYQPSTTYSSFLVAAGTGAIASIEFNGNSGSTSAETFDVWDAGSTGGAPSRSFTLPINGVPFGIMAHDGTIYATSYTASGGVEYLVIPAGSAAAARTIHEQIVPLSQQASFSPNYAAVGPDGTLYVTEFTFNQPDTLAGLYVYAPNGTETKYVTKSDANGAGPQGVDVDASGNIYVVNDNAAYNTATQALQADSLHDVQVFNATGAVVRDITGTAFTGYDDAVASDGTLFFSSFPGTGLSSDYGTYVIAAGTSTATKVTPFWNTGLVLYDGNRETTGVVRTLSASSHVSSHGGGFHRFARLARRR